MVSRQVVFQIFSVNFLDFRRSFIEIIAVFQKYIQITCLLIFLFYPRPLPSVDPSPYSFNSFSSPTAPSPPSSNVMRLRSLSCKSKQFVYLITPPTPLSSNVMRLRSLSWKAMQFLYLIVIINPLTSPPPQQTNVKYNLFNVIMKINSFFKLN